MPDLLDDFVNVGSRLYQAEEGAVQLTLVALLLQVGVTLWGVCECL